MSACGGRSESRDIGFSCTPQGVPRLDTPLARPSSLRADPEAVNSAQALALRMHFVLGHLATELAPLF